MNTPIIKQVTRDDMRTQIRWLENEIARLEKINSQLHARLSCMCGGDMDEHSVYEGHSPVSMYDYALVRADEENERLRAAQALVSEQANDEGLWFAAETCAEAYVQQALRRLHAAIEGISPEECARRALEQARKG